MRSRRSLEELENLAELRAEQRALSASGRYLILWGSVGCLGMLYTGFARKHALPPVFTLVWPLLIASAFVGTFHWSSLRQVHDAIALCMSSSSGMIWLIFGGGLAALIGVATLMGTMPVTQIPLVSAVSISVAFLLTYAETDSVWPLGLGGAWQCSAANLFLCIPTEQSFLAFAGFSFAFGVVPGIVFSVYARRSPRGTSV